MSIVYLLAKIRNISETPKFFCMNKWRVTTLTIFKTEKIGEKKNWKNRPRRSFQFSILVSLFPHPQHICHHLHQPKRCEEERPKQRKFH